MTYRWSDTIVHKRQEISLVLFFCLEISDTSTHEREISTTKHTLPFCYFGSSSCLMRYFVNVSPLLIAIDVLSIIILLSTKTHSDG